MLLSMAAFSQPTGTYENLIPIDAVLVLDVSLSMQTADPYRVSRDAMNLFISRLTPGRDRVGIVSYAGRVEASLELTPVAAGQFEAFIAGLDYASWTDHGLGLREAVGILYRGHDSQRQQAIIFLTDGNLNVNPWGQRSTQQAQQDIAAAMDFAQEKSFPIFTIGLNFDGSLDAQAMQQISQATGGISFETANATDLPGIMSEIFSMMTALPPPEPTPTPTPSTPTPQEEPPTYIEQYIPQQPYNETTRNKPIIAAAVVLVLVIILLRRNKKRVFTGVLTIEATENGLIQPAKKYNLIEFGSRISLQNLTNLAPGLGKIIISPNPKAPSHRPQLLIKNKSREATITRGFITEAAKKSTLSPGEELTVSLGEFKIHLRYG